MSESTQRHAVRDEVGTDPGEVTEAREPQPPTQAAIPVHVGGFSNPLVFGLPVFVAGSLVLGFALVGFVPIPSGLGSVLPETTFAAGLGEFTTALWAIIVGNSIVASIFGLFGVFWFSLFVLVTGLFNDWFKIPTASTSAAEVMFFLAWTIVFVLLTLAILRLPIAYILILFFVDLAVLFNLLAIGFSLPILFVAAGAAVLAFCAIGLYAFLNVAWEATGATHGLPPLGPPLWR